MCSAPGWGQIDCVPLPVANIATPDPLTAATVTALVLILAVRFVDVWEREPLWLVLVLALWGATGAVLIAAPLNEFVLGALPTEEGIVWGAAISAPVVEELAKGAALAVVYVVTRHLGRRAGDAEFDGVIDGIVYGVAIGVGFAFAENNFYFLREESLQQAYETLAQREGFLNLNVLGHAVYTGVLGAAMGLATRTRSTARKVGLFTAGLLGAIALHAFHNGLVPLLLVTEYGLESTAAAFSGVPLPPDLLSEMRGTVQTGESVLDAVDYAVIAGLIALLVLCVCRQRAVLASELTAEHGRGFVTREECTLMTGYGRRLKLYARLTLSGRLGALRANSSLHHELAALAFLNERERALGTDSGEIRRVRQRLPHLRELVRVG